MRAKNVLRGSGIFIIAIAAVVLLGTIHFERVITRFVDELLADAESHSTRTFTSGDLEELPEPVQQYFENVLKEGQPYLQTIRLQQQGEFRLGDATAPWKPLTATQHFTTQPPGFVWDATINILPLLPARVIDMYKRGDGILRARLLSIIPVASVGPSPEMDESELVRYLAEAVWFPTALLPTHGVEWEAIDDHSARAILKHRERVASLRFHFNDQNEVERVTTERYRQEDDDHAPWTGYFGTYETQQGMRIPINAEVQWNLPDGDLSYWRASTENIDYQPAVTSKS